LRNLVYRFEDLHAFGQALRSGDQELPVPEGERVGDGEWVLAIFEIGTARGRATAAAARGLDRMGELVLAFERRDWERLIEFADAPSEHLRAAAPTTDVNIPVDVDDLTPPPRKRSTVPEATPVPSSRTKPKSKPGTTTGAFGAVGAGARVMLVDDDRDIRDVVGAMLEAVGLAVETATSAEEALERMRARPPSLVVLDWNLPGMTGIELCRVVRREPRLSSMPVLFLTAHASSRDVVEAFASGADDYVVKPFRAPELGARIFGLLRRVRLAQPGT
jgi:two-component system phosphate regulon response regulator PhoB